MIMLTPELSNGSSDFAYAYLNDGRKATVGQSRSGYGQSWQIVGDTIGIAFDADNGTVRFYNNGVDQGIAFSNIDTSNGLHYICQFDDSNTGHSEQMWNFGQKPFKFSPPDGFQPLTTANVRPVNVISRPDQYVGISTWSGDSAASRNIDIGIKKPDLVWVRNRFVGGRSNYLYDSVRGFAANKEIVSNSNVEEGSSSHLTQNHGYVSGNIFNGFTLTEGTTNSNYTNQSGQSYVGWSWRELVETKTPLMLMM